MTRTGNTGIVPPWLIDPPRILPMPEPVEPADSKLKVTLLASDRPITLRHGFIDAVLSAGAFCS